MADNETPGFRSEFTTKNWHHSQHARYRFLLVAAALGVFIAICAWFVTEVGTTGRLLLSLLGVAIFVGSMAFAVILRRAMRN